MLPIPLAVVYGLNSATAVYVILMDQLWKCSIILFTITEDKDGETIQFTLQRMHSTSTITFYQNGGNGWFGKSVGNVHHVHHKYAENGVDVFWTKYVHNNNMPDHYEDPNIRESLFMGKGSDSRSQAIFGPQNEFWFVNGATFVNYGEDVGAISACAKCCDTKKRRQGGYTYRFANLKFDNSPKRVEWTCPYKQIFFDLDGSLTGIANGTATPFYKFNEWPGVCEQQDETYDEGIVCDSSVRVRRLQVRGVTVGGSNPYFNNDKRLGIRQSMIDSNGEETLSHGNLNWTRLSEEGIMFDGNCTKVRGYDNGGGCIEWEVGHDFINYLPKDYSGWAVPLATHVGYYLDFDYYSDWNEMEVRWSEPYYIQKYPAEGESVLLRWPYIDYRYRFNVTTPQEVDESMFDRDQVVEERPWGLGTVLGSKVTDDSGNPVVLDRDGEFGQSQMFLQDDSLTTSYPNGEVRIAVNPFKGINWTEATLGYNRYGQPDLKGHGYGPLRYHAERLQCAPAMCGAPGEGGEMSQPFKWSDEHTWTLLGAYSKSNVTQSGTSLTENSVVMAWQLRDQLAIPDDRRDHLMNLEIPPLFFMVFDVNNAPHFNKLVVSGKLEFDRSPGGAVSALTLEVNNLLVYGEFHIGSAEVPYPSDILASVVVYGYRSTTETLVIDEINDLGNKVIGVFGRMELHGTPVSTIYKTTLAQTAAARDTTITLSEEVDWPVGSKLIISSTEYDVEQDEIVTVAAVNGAEVTLTRRLSYRHFAGWIDLDDDEEVFLGAHVALLDRNVVIRGDIDTNYWYKGYGAHIVVGERENANGSPRIGQLYAKEVLFDEIGKHNSEHAGIFVRHRNVDSTSAITIITDCSISSWSHAIVASGSFGLEITNNVISRSYDNGIEIDPESRGTILDDNLLVGNRRMPSSRDPFCDLTRSCRYKPFAAIHLWNEHMTSFQGNVVAGSEDTGISTFPLDECYSDSDPIMQNNEVYGAVVGVNFLDTHVQSCRLVKNVRAWKNGHMGIHTSDQTSNMVLEGIVVADNHIGVLLNFVRFGQGNKVVFQDSVVLGSTDASTCSGSVACKAVSPGDVEGITCGSTFGDPFRRVGLVIPQYTNIKKTCGAGTKRPQEWCTRPMYIVRQCNTPLDKRSGNLGAGDVNNLDRTSVIHAEFVVRRVHFGDFENQDCDKRSQAISVNPSQPDLIPVMYFSKISWSRVGAIARMQLGDTTYMNYEAAACRTSTCDAIMNMKLYDQDGTTSIGGNPVLMLSDLNIYSPKLNLQGSIADGSCVYSTETGSLDCTDLTLRHTVLEVAHSVDRSRRLGPLVVDKYGARNNTFFSVGPFGESCTCQKHFARFDFEMEPGNIQYDVTPFGSMSSKSRVVYMSTDEDDHMLLRIFYTQPFGVNVEVDGNPVQPLSDGSVPDVNALATYPAGTNVLHPQERLLYLVVKGGAREYNLHINEAIQVTTSVQMSLDNFYCHGNLETFVQTLQALLGTTNVAVVCVHNPGEPCFIESDPNVDCNRARERRQGETVEIKYDIKPEEEDEASYIQVAKTFTEKAADNTLKTELGKENIPIDDATVVDAVPSSVFGATIAAEITEKGGLVITSSSTGSSDYDKKGTCFLLPAGTETETRSGYVTYRISPRSCVNNKRISGFKPARCNTKPTNLWVKRLQSFNNVNDPASCSVFCLSVDGCMGFTFKLSGTSANCQIYGDGYGDVEVSSDANFVMFYREFDDCVGGMNPDKTSLVQCDTAAASGSASEVVPNRTLAECAEQCDNDSNCGMFSFTLKTVVQTEMGIVDNFADLVTVAEIATTTTAAPTVASSIPIYFSVDTAGSCGTTGIDAARSQALETLILGRLDSQNIARSSVEITFSVACENTATFAGYLGLVLLESENSNQITSVRNAVHNYLRNGHVQIEMPTGGSLSQCQFEEANAVAARLAVDLDFIGTQCAPDNGPCANTCTIYRRGKRYLVSRDNN